MSLPCLKMESQGCDLIPLSNLFYCFSDWFSCSSCVVIFVLTVHSSDILFSSPENSILLRVGLFCLALVEQLRDDSC